MTRHLITSALPYINGIKHLGNLVGSMLPADVYTRYLRQRGEEALYICATDEHGTPAELAAKAAGLPVAEFCAQQHDAQKAVYDGFGLAFDYFGRSSSAENRDITQHFARKLHENGFIEERAIRQVFSIADDRFLPDRYIVGTCPHCGYDKARGDQCENCTRVLDPTDLIEPRSAISGSSELEVRETKHLFLLQSKLSGEVEAWIDETSDEWPHLASSIARKWLTEGLHDRSITRDLEWGVPVPADTWPELAAEGKVFYVWFDAPIEYVGATKEWADLEPETRDWKSWWYEASDVRYTQFMAKDNVPFHTVMFPAMQIGTREPVKRVDHVKAFNWLNYYGGKFSTSQQRGIFSDTALELLPADYWRYFLMAQAPESDDTSFTWELFATSVNKDLADTLGNFVNRVLSFSRKRFGDEVPAGKEAGEAERKLGEEIARLLAEYEGHMEALQFRKAAQALRALWSAGNSYLEEKAPWLEIKTDQDGAALTLRTAMNLIHLYAVVSEPFIPSSARAMREAFALADDTATWVSADEARALASVPAGTAFTVPPVLFAKITDEDLEAWRSRFGAQ
ncbi:MULTISPECIES: methionine--tRNA ligase [Streptomyces]|uniref:Methionine--tRNA ligase n=1 Tax=Streptomyces drozdowiczii TaxID=202862 RepID=A0ABY6PQB5_9ACTN|nr:MULTISPECIES: methionine--tRNA ligase [Streptomyces]MCX0246155.1 methionine--tRNA ligase [Streptomyces drozdowiczii]OKJ77664.1 methionyl-tRNA synthetase [Streptomyces sp. CB02460]UZK54296.1 methionine--tRNA ligase [Streptomyces drozdowiczii]